MNRSRLDTKRVIVALDFADAADARAMLRSLDPAQCRIKIGKELFTRAGPELVREFTRLGFEVFLDLKFHDIPNTVAAACRAAAELDCWMINVHASGGAQMMRAARNSLDQLDRAPLLIAVTVLTSLDQDSLREAGFSATPAELARRLALLAQDSGLDGVVCSPHEIELIKNTCGPEFLTVTPGVRPEQSGADDQKRTATPAAAISAGADYLVIGRPITQATDPGAALESIIASFASAVRDAE